MKLHHASLFAAAAITSATLLLPATAGAQQAQAKVRQAVEEAAQGRCSDILSTPLKSACDQQIAQTAEVLQSLGPIKAFEFRGMEQGPNGEAESYVATYESVRLVWMATTTPDGKLNGLWSPGRLE